ncbi:AraC family transcriptional regulator [Saccharibacillus sp. CPCC 101409]|uniref:helix-turn-helix domain-containing protein n=1 Tax=Saccharibacillus sp. CPCC 101409 TaxID=3058041 RepID=UPI002673C3B4|nr:AraC family transcriptional regulator [Saccharibacillus sp. CPCC 101409]MDO3412559.1 AraC family transcriptional regulator [Saccharibacillus sp. CPCC 101409]
MHKKWLYRLILSYLPILFAVVSCLVIVFFMTLSETVRKQTLQANGIYAQNVLQVVDTALKSIETPTIKGLLLSDRVSGYFGETEGSTPYRDYGVTETLLDFMSPLPMIDSVYLYRAADDKVLMQSFSSTLADFGDRPFIERALDDPLAPAWSGLRRMSLFVGDREPRAVVSLGKPVPYFSGEQGLIVVNVRKESIQSLLQETGRSDVDVCIRDTEGGIIGGSEQSCSDEGGREAIGLVSPYTGWQVEVRLAASSSFSLLSAFSNLWALLGFAAIVGGIAAMTYISHRHYRPLAQVINRIAAFAEQQRGGGPLAPAQSGDEFALIERSLEKLIEQANDYERQQAEGLPYRRAFLFKELLENGVDMPPERWNREAQNIGVTGEFEVCAVGVAEIDAYEQFAENYSARDRALFKFMLRSVVQEIADECGDRLWAEWIGPDRLGLLYRSQRDSDRGIEPARLAAMAEQAGAWLRQNAKFTATFGFGGAAEELRGITGSYRMALAALDRKVSEGPDRAYIFGRAGDDGAGGGMDALVQTGREAALAFRLGGEWEELVERFFAQTAGGGYSKEDIVRLMTLLRAQFRREMQELPQPMQDIWSECELRGIPEEPEGFEWIGELRGPLLESLREAQRRLGEERMNREHYELANRMRQYVAEHYRNPDFSLTQIGEALGGSAKTISRIFKEETGEKFVDYLAKLRIEEAKRMLAGTEESVQDIAERVGYVYPMSFIRMFKKLEGLTPGEYRKASQTERRRQQGG